MDGASVFGQGCQKPLKSLELLQGKRVPRAKTSERVDGDPSGEFALIEADDLVGTKADARYHASSAGGAVFEAEAVERNEIGSVNALSRERAMES